MEFYLIFICQAVSFFFFIFSQSFKNTKTILSLQAMQREMVDQIFLWAVMLTPGLT